MNEKFFQLVKSIHPETMCAVEKAIAIKKIVTMAKEYDVDVTNTEIAKIVKLSNGGLSQFLKVSKMPFDVLELAKSNPKKFNVKLLYGLCPRNYEMKNNKESFESVVRKRFYEFLKNKG